jgi:hypothetical protein
MLGTALAADVGAGGQSRAQGMGWTLCCRMPSIHENSPPVLGRFFANGATRAFANACVDTMTMAPSRIRLHLHFQKATATLGSQFIKLGFDVLKQMGNHVHTIDARSLRHQSQGSDSYLFLCSGSLMLPGPGLPCVDGGQKLCSLVLPFKKARGVRTRPDDQIKRPAAAAALCTWGSITAASLT